METQQDHLRGEPVQLLQQEPLASHSGFQPLHVQHIASEILNDAKKNMREIVPTAAKHMGALQSGLKIEAAWLWLCAHNYNDNVVACKS